MYKYTCKYIHTHVHIHKHIGICYIAGLEMGGVALQNANHFWGNCESLWQNASQYCEYCESLLVDLRITFQMVSQKRPFLVFTTF